MAAVAHSSDSASLLVQLCIKRLKNSASGMTTKELAAELDDEITEGFSGISSSVLSSKLNAVFRRCRNVSKDPSVEKLAELPLSRAQSTELPRRLVYRYTPLPDSASNNQTESTNETNESSSLSKAVSRPHSSSELGLETSSEYKDLNPDTSAPLTPKEDYEDQQWPSSKRLRTEKPADLPRSALSLAEARSTTPPPTATPPLNAKPQLGRPPADESLASMKFNLYYDVVDFDAVTAALDCSDISSSELARSSATQNDPDHWVEYISPERFALNELDQLIN